MMNSTALKYYKSVDGIDYYIFRPSFGNWYYKDWEGYIEDKEKHKVSHWLRMCLEYFEGGYQVFYAVEDKKIKGYSLIARGGRRLKCSSTNDIVIGPYYVAKQYRNNGFASKMIRDVLYQLEIKSVNVFMYIKKTNISSIKVAEKNGARYIGNAGMRGFLRRIYLQDKGLFYVMKWSGETIND